MKPKTLSMTIVQIARVTLEFTSPLAIGSGQTDDLLDAPLVLDADGLPALPGSSVAGVLRSRAEQLSNRNVNEIFGCIEDGTGHQSQLRVSWGRPHDRLNQPIAPRAIAIHPTPPSSDPILARLKTPTVRDHVRLNSWGAVDGRGKFDRSFVPAGARFTLELRLDDSEIGIEEVLGWLHNARFGSVTRAGFGQSKIVSAQIGTFDLSTDEGKVAWCKLPTALWEKPVGLKPWSVPQNESEPTIKIRLKGEHGLLIGGGFNDEGQLTYFVEDYIHWDKDQGSVRSRPLLPGTALKGALRHRTAFHLRVLESVITAEQELDELFGQMKGDEHAAAGKIYVHEVELPKGLPLKQTHVSLDRFTMGPLDGHLFTEEALWVHDVPITLTLTLIEPLKGTKATALRRAIEDLCEGRLGLGHGASRGHGFFSGTFDKTALLEGAHS